MTNARTVLVVGLYVEDQPGVVPPRFEHLPATAATLGLGWTVQHLNRLDPAAWHADPPAGIILTGSKHCLGEDCTLDDYRPLSALLDGLPRVPVFGICFGHQFLNHRDGGTLERFGRYREDNDFPITLGDDPLFAGLPNPCHLPENHGQRVATPGRGWRVVATSDDGIEATRHESLPRISFQFHPEYWPRSQHPDNGRTLVTRWLSTL